MTAAEQVKKFTDSFPRYGTYLPGNCGKQLEELLKEFTKIKVKEALEIAAKKAKTEEYYSDPFLKPRVVVDKDSILNAINLDEFIK